MKYMLIEFPDDTPVVIQNDTEVVVSGGSQSMLGGRVYAIIQAVNPPETALADHTHTINGAVTGSTGPPEEVE